MNYLVQRNGAVHPALRRQDIQPVPAELYVVAGLCNPLRWRSRYKNYWEFAHHCETHGAKLITVELQTGERRYEITDPDNPMHLQLSSRDELFCKENLQNLGFKLVPAEAKYVAFVDADMIFTRPDWVQETIHQLQHYDIVQMFTSFTDLLPDFRTGATHPSFMWNYFHQPAALDRGGYGPKWMGSPGGAWAYRVEAFKLLGGLMDRCILGAADAHMAYGLAQREEGSLHVELQHGTPQYRLYVKAWQANAAQLRKNIGYVDSHMIHKWHGPRSSRGYTDRWQILNVNNYDPYLDVTPDSAGVLELTGNKPKLRDDIRLYFRTRIEDENSSQ